MRNSQLLRIAPNKLHKYLSPLHFYCQVFSESAELSLVLNQRSDLFRGLCLALLWNRALKSRRHNLLAKVQNIKICCTSKYYVLYIPSTYHQESCILWNIHHNISLREQLISILLKTRPFYWFYTDKSQKSLIEYLRRVK